MKIKETVTVTENKAKVFATFFCWQKEGISKELFSKYWRDVHAIWAARSPGFHQYRQLHLDKVNPALLEGLEGIETDLPKDDQPDRMAHIAYSSVFIANLLRKSFALKQADEDNAIFVSRNTYQRSILPVSRTIVDKINNPDTNGYLKQPRYVLAFKKHSEASVEDYIKYLNDDLCGTWSKKEQVQRLRLDMMESHVNEPASPKGVKQHWDKDKQYQAWIELELKEDAVLSSLFKNDIDFKKYISAVHAYPIREIYTIVFDGKPTLVGLRGYEAVQTIEAANANFQKSREVLKFTYGSLVNGGSLIPSTVFAGVMGALIGALITVILTYFL